MSRFGAPLSADALASLAAPVVASNTKKGNESAWKAFVEWRNHNRVPTTRKLLADELVMFVPVYRQKNGKDYKSRSLKTNVLNIVRYVFLKNAELPGAQLKEWNFDKDSEFAGPRNILSNVMAILQKKESDKAEQSVPFSTEQLQKLFECDLLSTESIQGLYYRIYLVIGLSTAERITWHVELAWSKLYNEKTVDGVRFIEIYNDPDKNNRPGMKFISKPHCIYENKEDSSKCIFFLRDTLAELRPPTSPDRLYLKIHGGKLTRRPIGKSGIAKWPKRFATAVGLEGKVTNHSIRASVCTILYRAGVPEKLITDVSHHNSLGGVRSYERTGPKQLQSTIQHQLFQMPQVGYKRMRRTYSQSGSVVNEEKEELSPSPPEKLVTDQLVQLVEAVKKDTGIVFNNFSFKSKGCELAFTTTTKQ